MARGRAKNHENGALLGFEAKLWQTADALRNNMDAAEYKHVVLGLAARIAHGDTFHNDRNPDLKADYVLANPPFNDSDWRGELLKDDKRWVYGTPPAGNANFAWVQHFIHHLSPTGIAGFVLANGSMSSNQSGEGEIRKNIIEADLVDCMVALPGQLFYSAARLSLDGAPDPGARLRLRTRPASRTLNAAADERRLLGAESDSLLAEDQGRRDRGRGEDHPGGVTIGPRAAGVAGNAGRSAAPVVNLTGKPRL